jgi:GT2 family glycosyltransferase
MIIPNKDNRQVLARCLQSVASNHYPNYEVLVVENNSTDPRTFQYYEQAARRDSRIRIVRWEGPFNYSAINNFAVARSQGEMILLLNNDVEAINRDWVERLLEHALRPEVGAVGAKFYYPDDTVQHGGVILGLQGLAGHAHLQVPRSSTGYFGRLVAIQNLSAVTAACLMMRRHVFDEIGGFDERLTVQFNDVDLCVKIITCGYRILWTPFAELYHRESHTRGKDDTPEKAARSSSEVQLFFDKWRRLVQKGDPYYNSNLSLLRHDFVYRGPGEPSGNPVLGPFLDEDEPLDIGHRAA